MYVMPGCIYKYTVGDKLAAERALERYQRKHLDVCLFIAYRTMDVYGTELWKNYINEDKTKPIGVDCEKVVPLIEQQPRLYEDYKLWQQIKG